MATRKRARRISLQVQAKIEELADRGFSPIQIHRELSGMDVDQVDLRTVQRIVRERLPADDSGPWELDANAGTEAAAIIEVLAAVVAVTGGVTKTITRLEATWVETVAAVAPDLAPWTCYRVARLYAARRARGESTLDLDVWLGLAPWRPGRRELYEKLVTDGTVPRPPIDPLDQDGHESARRLVDAVIDGANPKTVPEVVRRLTELTPDDPQDAILIEGLIEGLISASAPTQKETQK